MARSVSRSQRDDPQGKPLPRPLAEIEKPSECLSIAAATAAYSFRILTGLTRFEPAAPKPARLIPQTAVVTNSCSLSETDSFATWLKNSRPAASVAKQRRQLGPDFLHCLVCAMPKTLCLARLPVDAFQVVHKHDAG